MTYTSALLFVLGKSLRSGVEVKRPHDARLRSRVAETINKLPLPIDEALDQLITTLDRDHGAVIIAPPGSGKTTRVPLSLLAHEAVEGKVLMLQPRRVAARSTAQWMAQQIGERLGESVGFQVRHERAVSAQTRLEVITEGLLIQRLLSDPELEGIGAVILDEFHERSLAADLSLMMLLESRVLARPELKLIVMSATLEPRLADRVSELIEAPVITAEGRSYPVKISYATRPMNQKTLTESVTRAILDFWEKTLLKSTADIEVDAKRDPPARSPSSGGHCLVFLPGRSEIEAVRSSLARVASHLTVTPLYGALSVEAQRKALDPHGSARVILATNIAETSLTIRGVTHVIDSGLRRHVSVDPLSGLPRLLTSSIALDSATQRAGRAGRTQRGSCLRLWTPHEEERRPAETPAEVHESDLSQALLWVADWSGDWRSFTWFEEPPSTALKRAEEELIELRVLDQEKGQLTALGAGLSQLPTHPSIGLALCWGSLLDCLDEVALLGALSTAPRDLLDRPPESSRARDPWLRVEALADLEAGRAWSDLRVASAREVRLSASQLKRRALRSRELKRSLDTELESLRSAVQGVDPLDLPLKSRVALCFARGMPRRLARLRARTAGTPTLTYHLAGGGEAHLKRSGLLGEPELIVALSARVDLRGQPQIELALEVERAWLNPRVEQSLIFNAERGGVYQVTTRSLGQITLEERSAPAPSSDLAAQRLFSESVAADPWRWLSREPRAQSWLHRFEWLTQQPEIFAQLSERSQSPAPRWAPPLNDEDEPLAQLISAVTSGLTQSKSLASRPLLPLILGLTPPEWARWVKLYAPERFTLPTGQEVEIRYEQGHPPTVSAYLQAFFGERAHPHLGGETAPILLPLRLELLAPNRRVAQITSDLPSFWTNSYATVRRDLRGRYPKHHWPEDPLSIGPQRGAKRRK